MQLLSPIDRHLTRVDGPDFGRVQLAAVSELELAGLFVDLADRDQFASLDEADAIAGAQNQRGEGIRCRREGQNFVGAWE